MLKQVICGGQTGIDRLSIDLAKIYGIPTGGTAPKGWRTENGPDMSLQDYGLIESEFSGYTARTEKNVKDSDGTVLFGDLSSSGSLATIKMCVRYNKPYIKNPTPEELYEWIVAEEVEILNAAGNRGSILRSKDRAHAENSLSMTFKMLGYNTQ